MKKLPTKLQPWLEARAKLRLSHAHIQMARELGMNPRHLASLANTRAQPWKAPLPDFITDCYVKRFGRLQPEQVRTLEAMARAEDKKKQERRDRKQARRQGIAAQESTGHPAGPGTAEQPAPQTDAEE